MHTHTDRKEEDTRHQPQGSTHVNAQRHGHMHTHRQKRNRTSSDNVPQAYIVVLELFNRNKRTKQTISIKRSGFKEPESKKDKNP